MKIFLVIITQSCVYNKSCVNNDIKTLSKVHVTSSLKTGSIDRLQCHLKGLGKIQCVLSHIGQRSPWLLTTPSPSLLNSFYALVFFAASFFSYTRPLFIICFCSRGVNLKTAEMFVFGFSAFFFFFFQNRVSLCDSGWPGTLYVHQAGLKLTAICLLLPFKYWD